MIRYAFGPFSLEPSERRLWRAGAPVDIEPKAFDLLVALVERAGHLVGKDELLAEVWPDAVVENNALTVQVSKLRAALGESARAWHYVETVPRVGYRFAPVVHTVVAEGAPPARRRAWTPRAFRIAATLTGLGAVALVLAALGGRGGRGVPAASPVPVAASAGDRAAARVAYDRARAQWWTRTDLDAALVEFRRASVLDPSFALAHVGVADVQAMRYQAGAEARASLRRALALDPGLGQAHATLGLTRMLQEWDWDGAAVALARARTLAPDYAPAHQWTATLEMLRGRPQAALVALGRALAVAPVEARPVLLADRCQALYLARRYAAAAADCRRALDANPDVAFAAVTGFWSLALDGRADDAVRWARAYRVVAPEAFQGAAPTDWEGPEGPARLARQLFIADARPDAIGTLDWNARVAAFAGERERALALLEEAVAVRHFFAPFLAVDPAFDGLRDEPRFRRAVAAIGLAE